MASIIEKLEGWSEYNYMLLFLFLLNAYASFTIYQGTPVFTEVWIRIIAVPLFAGLVDLLVNKFVLKGGWKLPRTGLISGLFIAGIFDPTLPIYVQFTAAIIALLAKHLIKKGRINTFNPAGIGIGLTGLLFTFGFGMNLVGSWWIGTTLLVVPLGLYLSHKIEKLPLTLTFFILFPILLFGLPQLSGSTSFSMDQILNPSFLSGYLFFSAFMLLEPKTTPYTLKGMVAFGALVAILAALMQIYSPAIGGIVAMALRENTLIALLIMNLFTGILNSKLPDA